MNDKNLQEIFKNNKSTAIFSIIGALIVICIIIYKTKGNLSPIIIIGIISVIITSLILVYVTFYLNKKD